MDKLSKSDPFAVAYMKTELDPHWREIGRTEIISNTQDPVFSTKLTVTYVFEEVQHLRLEIYDADSIYRNDDSKNLPLGKQDFQGASETTLAAILGSVGQMRAEALVHPKQGTKGGSQVVVRAEEVAHQHDLVSVKLRGEKVEKKDLLSSDPFLKLKRINEDGSGTMVYKTEVKRATLNPKWAPIRATVSQLANGDPRRPLNIECWDYDTLGTHDFIGSCQASIEDLRMWSQVAPGAADAGLELINPTKQGTPKYKHSGVLCVDSLTIEPRPSFLDYIAGGTEVSFSVAIDYTGSNGHPADPRSLHYVDPTGQTTNPYAAAMQGIGSVLEFYDTDKMFPVLGFGGKLGPGQPANHCFAVNGSSGSPEVQGMAGVLQTYYNSLHNIQLSGPTLFQDVINSTAAEARSMAHSNAVGQKYLVLCIITDGVINDMDATRHAIVQASNLPLSIVIVGVGEADFANMEALDSDQQRLISPLTMESAARDIVQFVPMRNFKGQGVSMQHALAKHVLAEIPGQFLSYMSARGVPPAPKRAAAGTVPTPAAYSSAAMPSAYVAGGGSPPNATSPVHPAGVSGAVNLPVPPAGGADLPPPYSP